jgi:surface protein
MIINVSTLNVSGGKNVSFIFGIISNLNVNWGDGTQTINTTSPIQHTYANISSYTIKITGYASTFRSAPAGSGTSNPNIIGVSQWGTLGFSSLYRAFRNTTNLVGVPTSIPASVTDISFMFLNASQFNQNISDWNTSNVTNMAGIFADAILFNQPLNNWNTSSVTDMSIMFSGASQFNQNISSWNTSNVTNMAGMFLDATLFDQPLNNWNTSSVTNMNNMFYDASQFNQNISSWNTSNVIYMNGMFANATLFDKPLNNWNTSSVTVMNDMFSGASQFNQPLNNWNTSSVTNMASMFSGAIIFNKDVSMWNVLNVLNADYIFCGCPEMLATPSYWPRFITNPMPIWGCSPDPMIINIQTVQPDTSMSLPFHIVAAITVDWGEGGTPSTFSTTIVEHTYGASGYYPITVTGYASTFGNGIGGIYTGSSLISTVTEWGTIGLTSLTGAFSLAINLVGVPSYIPASVTDVSGMFLSALQFNQDISGWDTLNVTDMSAMFYLASSFNQDISGWSTSNA